MRTTSLLAGLAFLCGCGASHYSYPLYTPASPPFGKVLPVRAAIPYPEEGMSAPNRDADIEPIVTASCPQSTYISPRLEVSRGLLDELRATGAFRVLDWAPESTDNYDLIVRLKLVSGGKPYASKKCPLLMGPFVWDVVVTDQRGGELDRRRLTQAKIKVFAGSPVVEYRKDERALLEKMVPPILVAAQWVAARSDLESARAVNFVDKRDPELKGLRAEIASAGNPALEKKYLLKLAAVESSRAVEEKTTEEHQKLNDEAWTAVQERAGKELREVGEQAQKAIAQSFQMLLGGIAGAGMIPGVMPSALRQAASLAQGTFAQSVSTPSGAQSFLGGVPSVLLPGKASRFLTDAQFGLELVQSLSGAGQQPPANPPGPSAK
jgi:hypothetical protein